jgi:hypothetical protein
MEGERESIVVEIDAIYDTSKALSNQFYSFNHAQAQQLQLTQLAQLENAHCLRQATRFVLLEPLNFPLQVVPILGIHQN